jgi:DNA-binding IclR family transcriptional regulator
MTLRNTQKNRVRGVTGRALPGGGQAADVQSVRRAMQFLRAFSATRVEIGVSELAREHGLHPSSVSRLLRTLADAGFVRLNPGTGRYRLGFGVLELAGLLLHDLDVRTAARPEMQALAARSRATVNLAVLDGHEAVVVEQALADSGFRYASRVGRRIPLHATAHGKALLAHSTPAQQEALVRAITGADGRLARLTAATTVDPEALAAELRRTAERGFATAFGEMDVHLAGVAVPLFDHSGAVVASLALPGPVERYAPAYVECLAALAREAGRRISAELGWHTGEGPAPAERGVAVAGG